MQSSGHVNCIPPTEITLWLAGGIPIRLPVHLDETSSVPLRTQLCNQIRAMIVDGLLAPGSEVPSTRELSTQLHLADAHALQQLMKRAGVGIYSLAEGPATCSNRFRGDDRIVMFGYP